MKRLSKTRRREIFLKTLVDTRASLLSWAIIKQTFLHRLVGNRRIPPSVEVLPQSDGVSERSLYTAVLVRASQDYIRWETLAEEDISDEVDALGREALWWFRQKEEELVMVWDAVTEDVVVDWVPYRWVCTVLDLDPDAYFVRLRALIRKDCR